MKTYVSTSCLGFGKKASDIVKIYQDNGIKNIELGASHVYEEGIEDYIKQLDANFIIHGFFPPSKEYFVMNLASIDKRILRLSLEQVKRMIDLAVKLKAPLCSFHSGFRVNSEHLGKKFEAKDIVPYDKAFDIFIESIKEILKYTEGKNVKIAVELNVLNEFNIINSKNELLLMCEYWEIEELFKRINSDNLGILLDLGHLKVTSNWLNFDKDDFVEKVAEKVFEIHLHDNDSKFDSHLNVNKNSWAIDVLKRFNFKDIPITLEPNNLDIKEIKKTYESSLVTA